MAVPFILSCPSPPSIVNRWSSPSHSHYCESVTSIQCYLVATLISGIHATRCHVRSQPNHLKEVPPFFAVMLDCVYLSSRLCLFVLLSINSKLKLPYIIHSMIMLMSVCLIGSSHIYIWLPSTYLHPQSFHSYTNCIVSTPVFLQCQMNKASPLMKLFLKCMRLYFTIIVVSNTYSLALNCRLIILLLLSH